MQFESLAFFARFSTIAGLTLDVMMPSRDQFMMDTTGLAEVFSLEQQRGFSPMAFFTI